MYIYTDASDFQKTGLCTFYTSLSKVPLLLLLAVAVAIEHHGGGRDGQCEYTRSLDPRPHSVSILEFGAVGDGMTLNTVAFQNAIFYLKSFADKGGARLYVPSGRWLTGSINLTSHLTLFLERGATILGSQDYAHWEIVDPLPSYGRGIEFPGGRYQSLINGQNLSDVVITGDNGTIDGQGSVWWKQVEFHSFNHSRPHLVEFIGSNDITISNLTFLNSPAWHIHPVYCSNVLVENITAAAPPESPYTCGIVPDSSNSVCIENCNISMGYDAIVLKSGWDEYGIAYGKPTTNVHIRGVYLQSSSGAGLAFGSEMSGGISHVLAEQLHLRDSFIGVELKTVKGRGGYMQEISVSDVELENIHLAIRLTGQCGSHPDEDYDSLALPVVTGVSFRNMVGTNITLAGNLSGINESPFTSICLSNITFSIHSKSSPSWFCSNVMGISEFVSPRPCTDLQDSFSNSSSACFLLLYPSSHSTVL
ncbi:putative polygalacturonase [Morella rubra]|uniref:Putative polygalacturonase n=1 Tax=Morella rubra TaxID=262757 RepID=A0A6A1V8M5_9ROSI|nr:putative polygalacturonase [Morella rubra]